MSAQHAIDAEVRLYDHLFAAEDPEEVPEGGHWRDNLNPGSLEVLSSAKLEPALEAAEAGVPVQFERLGYFCKDAQLSGAERTVFLRTVTLRDTWAKIAKKG